MKYNQFEMAFGQIYGGFPEIRSRDSPSGEVAPRRLWRQGAGEGTTVRVPTYRFSRRRALLAPAPRVPHRATITRNRSTSYRGQARDSDIEG
jgi:hypothetical protein